jgi:branched-subunit amino acid transport protein
VSTLWITIVAVALASVAIRAFGPIVVGGRELPAGMAGVIALLVPSLLTALVVTQTFGEAQRLVLDEKAIGVAVAAVALALRAPVLLAVVLAVVATALARAFG